MLRVRWRLTAKVTHARVLRHSPDDFHDCMHRVECFCRIHAASRGAWACWVIGDHGELVGENFKKFLSVTPLKWELNNIKMHLSLQWRHWKANVQLAVHVKLLPSPFLYFRIIGNSAPMLFWVSLALNPKSTQCSSPGLGANTTETPQLPFAHGPTLFNYTKNGTHMHQSPKNYQATAAIASGQKHGKECWYCFSS